MKLYEIEDRAFKKAKEKLPSASTYELDKIQVPVMLSAAESMVLKEKYGKLSPMLTFQFEKEFGESGVCWTAPVPQNPY